MKNSLSFTHLLKVGLISIAALMGGCTQGDWRTASREPAGIAPDPSNVKHAVIEFYAADAFGWRGWFAVHTWFAIKPENANEYTVYEVVGWRVNRGQPALYQYQSYQNKTAEYQTQSHRKAMRHLHICPNKIWPSVERMQS